jgi:Topoisomerase 6 subunit A/Spo11, Toprim domain
MDSKKIIDAVIGVTRRWSTQRKAEERESNRALRRRQALIRSRRLTVKDAAYAVMAQAYAKASNNGALPAHARQIMYAARPMVQEKTGRLLNDQYFTQQLLPDFLTENPDTTTAWDVVFDARGHFEEPHTGKIVPLGTLGVREYLEHINAPGDSSLRVVGQVFAGRCPKDHYHAVLFIEKEGFLPLFQAVHLAARFDLAIMSSKGLSVTAARRLVDRVCGEQQIPLLVLHDFDKSGFSIVGTFRRDTRRYAFQNKLEVIDLGLRLADVEANELQSEGVAYGKSNPRGNLRTNGATKEEIAFLCQPEGFGNYVGQRVELNAFGSAELVAWIEKKLRQCRVGKVIPQPETLKNAYRRAVEISLVNKALPGVQEKAREEAERMKLSPSLSLARQVQKKLSEAPRLSWDAAVTELVSQRMHVANS